MSKKPEAPYWTCDRWGTTSGPDRADPACHCSMCTARRYDLSRPAKSKRKKR